MRMKKLLLLSLFALGLVFSLISFVLPVLAQEESTISAKLKTGGSYELFWPLTAGKTMDDPFYFLKIWKEKFGGIFVFDDAKKTDYEVVLATKRVLEAEKLRNEGKDDLAIKTLEVSLSQLTLARGKFSQLKKEGDDFQSAKANLINKLSNLNAFLPKFAEGGQGSLPGVSLEIKDVVRRFLTDVQDL